jgi:hypothetical protein
LSKYRLSFTTGGLFVREAMIAAPFFLQLGDAINVRSRLQSENSFQQRTEQSTKRITREVVNRLASFSVEELELLQDGLHSERAQLMWIAACREYSFLREFAEEVVREKFLILAHKLSHGDFDSFFIGKSMWHEELEQITESTRKRLRSSTFLMLREADLLSEAGDIVPTRLSSRLADIIERRDPNELRWFPMTGQSQESSTS